ncbi:MAG: type II-A CRISPR-associated protein Csn2 [Eubacteriales bacterium]|nr:type II-A CRISPR-associated protein Csn2 [Eubacteriales bacterium]
MKLVYVGQDINIALIENKANVISIETPKLFSEIIFNLINQTQGKPGNFILSDIEKELSIEKNIDFVSNPFLSNINDKKVINNLYSYLSIYAQENLYKETMDLNRLIVEYLDKILNFSPYNTEYNTEIDISALFKIYGLKIESNCETLTESIINYIKAMHNVCHINIFVFLNLKQYISEEDLCGIYKCVFYEKIHIIILQGQYSKKNENESHLIIDKDLCIIKI